MRVRIKEDNFLFEKRSSLFLRKKNYLHLSMSDSDSRSDSSMDIKATSSVSSSIELFEHVPQSIAMSNSFSFLEEVHSCALTNVS